MKTSFHITSEISLPNDFIQLIEVSEKFCTYARLDVESKRLLEFAHYEREKQSEEIFTQIFKMHDGLQEKDSFISYWTAESVIVPSDHFKLQEAARHLDLLYSKMVKRSLLSEQVNELGVYNIYRLPNSIRETIDQLNISGYFHHHTVTLKTSSSGNQATAFIDFRMDEFSIILMHEERLLLAQIYTYTSPEDVLYHLLKIFSQLKISQREAFVFLSGFIDENSALMRELNKYFLHILFEKLSGNITLDGPFLDYPSHFFNSTSKLAACVSLGVN